MGQATSAASRATTLASEIARTAASQQGAVSRAAAGAAAGRAGLAPLQGAPAPVSPPPAPSAASSPPTSNPFTGKAIKYDEDMVAVSEKTTPDDPELEAVQASVSSELGAPAASVSVRRLRPSRPRLDAKEAEAIHAKNEVTVGNMRSAGEGASVIVSSPLRDEGYRSLALWDAMQANPALLDTPAALQRSFPALVALQVVDMANGGKPPPGTVMAAAATAAAFGSSVSGGVGGSGVALLDAGGSSSALQVLEKERLSALVTPSSGLDALLLKAGNTAAVSGVVAWGPPPPQTSPYDQLILNVADDEFTLGRSEMFELFARHKADPGYWTHAKLAEYYGTKEEWVEILMDTVTPPTFAQVDGEQYGVVAIKPTKDMALR